MTRSSTHTASETRDRIANWARHVQGRELLAETSRALGERVEVMPLKGILLGALGVVDAAERPISDVDVLLFGVGLRRAAARLSTAGFVITDVPIADGYLSLLPAQGEITVDLHTVLMPRAQGRLSPAYLREGARLRHDLFAVPVLVPTLAKLAVHTISNIIKDRVVHAHAHTAHDLRALLAALAPPERRQIVDDLRRLSLRASAALALCWAHEIAPNAASEAMLDELGAGLSRSKLRAQLHRMQAADHYDLRSRLRARACADALSLRLWAPAAAALDVASWPLRLIHLRAQEHWIARQRRKGTREE
jgi:hypothetical protein